MSWKNFELNSPPPQITSEQSLFKAAMVNALNPGPYIFWTLVLGPILLTSWRARPLYGVGFLAGFYSAVIATLLAIIIVFGTAQKLGPRITRALLGVSVIALLLFGLYQLWHGIFNI